MSTLSDNSLKTLDEEKKSRIVRKTKGSFETILKAILYISLLIIYIIPFIWMIFGSLRTETDFFQNVYPFSWNTIFPVEWSLKNYQDIFGLSADGQAAGLNFQQYILNSLIVAGAVVASSVTVSTMGAYFFARLKFPFKNVLMVMMILSMLLPIEATMVPLYIVVSRLGLADSYLGIIIPWYTSPFFIFSLTQFMKDIPYELDEAATIDGASKLGILWHVIIPNSIPGLVTNALIEFQFAWNLFYWPLIVASKKELLMLQVAIAGQSSMARIYYGRILAGATVASIPVIILFLLLQRYYVQGTALSGLKG